jgi:predicted alpha/beta-hydrolase family hydrolase
MSNYEIISLTITGYSGKSVLNRFYRQDQPATIQAILIPGLRYTCDMPLLYYPTKLLLQRGIDVLQLHTDYTISSYQSLPPGERAAWLLADAQAAVQVGRNQRSYSKLILIGKSIGTLALAGLVSTDLGAEAMTIWLTPLLHQPFLVNAALQYKAPVLFIAGSGDSTYDPDAMERIRQATGAEALVIDGADHSLEISGNLSRSLRALEEVIQAITRFLEMNHL